MTESDAARRELLLEEYRTLRQESLDSLGHRLTVVNFTFAALSIVISAMVATGSRSPGLVALLGIVFVPQGAKAGLFIWLGEYQRGQRAGWHLAGLEQRLNALTGVQDGNGLSWETELADRETHMSTPYIATIAFTIGTGWAGAVLGVGYATDWLRDRLSNVGVVASVTAIVVVMALWEATALRRFMHDLSGAHQEPLRG